MKELFATFGHKVRAIRHACTLDQAKDDPSTYVAKSMQPAYDYCLEISKDKAKREKGGKRAAMLTRVGEQVRGTEEIKSIFSSVCDMVRCPSSTSI